MKTLNSTLLLILLSSFVLSGALAAGSGKIQYTDEQKQAIADVDAIKELRETIRNDERFYKLSGTAPYLDIDKYEEFYDLIKDVEDNVLPEVNHKLDAWIKNYGSTSEEQTATYRKIFAEIKGGNITHRDWFNAHENFGYNYDDIKERISNVEKTRTACVEELLSKVDSSLNSMDAVLPEYRAPQYEKALKTLDIVFLFEPKNEKAVELAKKIKKDGKSALEEKEKQIDAGKWPGQYEKFSGPGSVGGLSDAALEWFQDDTDGWAKANPLLVAVKGDWVSAKKNFLGDTIQWGLPIWLAAHKKPDTDVVRVFSLTILTQEEKDIEKSPPFTGAWVGDNFDMRIKKLPGSASGSSDAPYILFRVLLSLALIALGAAAAAAKLSTLHPKMRQVIDHIIPHKEALGALAAIFGILFLLKNLLFLSPLVDILPQLLAITAGLILGGKLLESKTKEMKAPKQVSVALSKVSEQLSKNSEKLEKLKTHEIPLGIACLVTGLLHLLVGGFRFF